MSYFCLPHFSFWRLSWILLNFSKNQLLVLLIFKLIFNTLLILKIIFMCFVMCLLWVYFNFLFLIPSERGLDHWLQIFLFNRMPSVLQFDSRDCFCRTPQLLIICILISIYYKMILITFESSFVHEFVNIRTFKPTESLVSVCWIFFEPTKDTPGSLVSGVRGDALGQSSSAAVLAVFVRWRIQRGKVKKITWNSLVVD